MKNIFWFLVVIFTLNSNKIIPAAAGSGTSDSSSSIPFAPGGPGWNKHAVKQKIDQAMKEFKHVLNLETFFKAYNINEDNVEQIYLPGQIGLNHKKVGNGILHILFKDGKTLFPKLEYSERFSGYVWIPFSKLH